MEGSTAVFFSALMFVIVFTVLVFVHEMGHYLVAKRNGVRVEVFSIGFGATLYSWRDKSGTLWKISAVPLGGYVKFFGDAGVSSNPDEALSQLSPADKARCFHYKKLGQRAAIVAAGPLANFLLAIVLLAGLFGTVGQPYIPAVVGTVEKGSAAEEAGFEPGDRILQVGDEEIERFEDLQRIVQDAPGVPLSIGIERNGRFMVLAATPRLSVQTDNFGHEQKIGLLGISRSGVDYIRRGPIKAVWYAGKETVSIVRLTLRAVGQMVVGTRSAKELGGPLRIAEMSGRMAQEGIVTLIWFMGMLSINLGLINLFPVPMLDGGHLLYYAFEAIRGKPLGERTQEYGFRIGLALVLALMVFVTWNDLNYLPVVDFFTGFFS
jgi:regulator of sigma E protease